MADPLRLQVLLNAIDQVSGPFQRIVGGSNALRTALQSTQQAMSGLKRQSASVQGYTQLQQELGKLTAQIGQAKAAAAQHTDTLSALRQQQAELAGKTKAARQIIKAQSRELAQTTHPTDHLTHAYQQQKAALEALETQYHTVSNARRNARAQQREEEKTAQRLGQQHERVSSKLQQLEQQYQRSGVDTAQLADHQRTLQQRILATNQRFDEQRRSLERLTAIQAKARHFDAIGRSASMAGAGMSFVGHRAFALAMTPVERYAQQETAFTQLQAALMGANGKVAPEFAQINALASDLGNLLPGTTSDFINLMTVLSKQGISAQTILHGTGRAAAYLAVQLRMPVEEAGEFTAKMQDATRSTEGEMLRLADQMQRLSYMGMDRPDMLGFFGKASPGLSILRMKGLDAVKALAPLAYMTNQSAMEGGAAGNATRKILQSMMKTNKVDLVNDALQALHLKIHLNFTDGHGEFGGIDQMYRQLEKLKTLNTETRLGVLKKIFGDDAETLQTLTIMIDKGAAGYRDAQQRLAGQASLEQRVTKELGTLANLWDAASGTFVNGLASIGKAMAPDIVHIIQLLNTASQSFSNWADQHPRLAAGLGKLAIGVTVIGTALGGFLLTGGVAAMALGQIVKGAGLLVTVFEVLGPIIAAVNLPLVAIGATIVGVAALIWRYWQPIKELFSSLWTVFSGLFQGVVRMGSQIGTAVSGVLSGAFDQFKALLGLGGSPSLAPQPRLPVAETLPPFPGRLSGSGNGGGFGLANATPASASQYTINIHPAPGSDPHAIARAVSTELDRRQRSQAASRRARLGDLEYAP